MPTRSESDPGSGSICCGMPASNTLPSQFEAIDQHRRQQGLKTGQADLVEGARADPGHVDGAGTDVGDDGSLVVRAARLARP